MSRQGLSEPGELSLPHPPIATASLSRLLVGGVQWGTNMRTSFCQVVVSGLRRVNARVTSGPQKRIGASPSFTARAGVPMTGICAQGLRNAREWDRREDIDCNDAGTLC